jgi:indolepyruvate ferredoxin oxidoreductase beta subunit
MGAGVHSPLIPAGRADLVIALERHEALRAAAVVLKDGGGLIYYNTVWQPLSVRLNEAAEVTENDIQDLCTTRGINVTPVFQADLPDIRMQNIIVLAIINRHRLIPGIDLGHYQSAMADLMAGSMLEKNMALFDSGL